MDVATFGCEAVADVEPQALGLTYWFDAADEGEPYTVKIGFAGRRIGVKRKPGPRDSFRVVESIEDVPPGTGRVAVTTRVFDIAPGEWNVTASPVAETYPGGKARGPGSRRTSNLPKASSSGATAFGPVMRVRAPGARIGVWPALVGVGVVVALMTQRLLASRVDLPATRILLVSLVASLVGLAGAKLYYLVEHRGEDHGVLTSGMCIQGFVLGAIGAIVVGAQIAGMSIGLVLDVTAPGLLFGMTIGRYGCFFGGCCAGRPTGSRWGLWSSDRRLGVRRIPTQLFESTLALVIGVIAFLIVWNATPRPAGVVFVGTMAAYTLGRQVLFPLRDLPRKPGHGLILVSGIAAVILAIDIAFVVFR